jgi:uncharacterized protein
LLRRPEEHRRFLWWLLAIGLPIGGVVSVLHAHAQATGSPSPIPGMLEDPAGILPLAFAYAAVVLLWVDSGRLRAVAKALAAAGQMALTNYLTESVVLGFVFYGYGFGWFGRIGPAGGLMMAVILYGLQLSFSELWLQRYRFGPVEWLWRSLTYGQWQTLQRGELAKFRLQKGE